MSKYSKSVIIVLISLFSISAVNGQIVEHYEAQLLPTEYEVDNFTVGLWHFDEGQGLMAYDETNNNNDGILYGKAIFTKQHAPIMGSKYSISLNKKGLDQNILENRAYVSVQDTHALDLTQDFTIEAWVKRTSKETGIVLERGILQSYPYGGFSLEVYGVDGHLRLQKINSSYVVSNVTVDDNRWTHIAITNNVSSGEVKFYKNGILGQTVIDTNPILPTEEPLYIGYAIDGNWGWAPFFGYVDEVRISNKARDPSEFNVPK